MGSVPEGTATSQVLPLTFKEAIDRGLRNNLGILLVSDSTLAARGEKWKELGALLPNISGTVSENVNRINLCRTGLPLFRARLCRNSQRGWSLRLL